MIRLRQHVLTRAFMLRAWLAALVLVFSFSGAAPAAVQIKKAQARAEFQKAEELRERLAAQPEAKRRPNDYINVIGHYESAVRLGPTTTAGADGVAAMARLWAEMSDAFGSQKYAANAAEKWRFLIKQYPQNKAVGEARRALSALGNRGTPGSTSTTAAGRRESEAARPRPSTKVQPNQTAAGAGGTPDKPVFEPVVTLAERQPGRIAQVTSIRQWATPNYTRVVIELDAPVEYQAGRIANPDRIFFDLHGARLSPNLKQQIIPGDDNLLKRVRVSPYTAGISRIVLDVGQVRDYSAFLLPNPYRLVVDINGTRADPPREGRATGDSKATERAQKAAPAETKAAKPGSKARPDTQPGVAEGKLPLPERKPAASERNQRAETASKAADQSALDDTSEKLDISKLASATPIGSQPVFERVAPPTQPRGTLKASSSKEGRKSEAAEARPVDAITGRTARPTIKGDRSLTRALGLKMGTIVVDAGHGGHDTGTIGPSGLLEKDLALDVAKRLGALVKDRLGVEVVYTRSDDTFIPLETRTAIANQKPADLFVSIHANSSRDKTARGVETYYLNFTSSPEALEVAARENAVSDKSMHELQDLVKKITMNDKVAESRDFALTVQDSLYKSMSRGNAGLRNRGVKKAPFIVLISAHMPAILAEISFVSNPTDEKLLRKSEYCQKIAEALYAGIRAYANSLSGVKVADHRGGIEPLTR